MTLDDALAECPVIAIIRGVTPEEAAAVGDALHAAGVRVVEAPMNSPDPLRSVRILADTLAGRAVVGAGTVLTPQVVDQVADAGGVIAVSPDTRPAVIRRALERGLTPLPGFATATEAFQAYEAGARRLKLFPAATYGPAHAAALRAVLPADVTLIAVGGVGAADLQAWRAAGVNTFGMGGDLYKPGFTPEQVFRQAQAAVRMLAP